MKSYDMIASLGGNCSAAMQLKNRGLRREAYPLDWVYMESEASIRYLCEAFKNRFADFALQKNLKLMECDANPGFAKYSYRDIHTGFGFKHHFNERVDLDEAVYNRCIATMRRRIARFLDRLDKAQDVLFILTVRFDADPNLVVKLKETLAGLYPGKTIDIHFKMSNAKLSNPLTLAEAWPPEYGFAGGERCSYDSYPYSFEYAGGEWAFLDCVELRGLEKPKLRGCAKLIYKVWKSTGKWLNERGYKVKGVRF